ncbi:exoribonuclease R [Crossiella equi]|uniref:Exoribonuclease R n=1 Tax=Crossiella equi TaxID=130796 RepID=A0ABS5ABC9_9PSEU|nr:RNB domain-containing ribonuclease [Crossiella equi]MBP2473879.1 exoribonuclease R [Crossiella equi]
MPERDRAAADFAAIRAEYALPGEFPTAALAEAEQTSSEPVHQLPRRDATGIPLVTIDPPGSKDLDQAVCVTRRGTGFLVHYAIADLGAVVPPGGPLDTEVRRRGQTLYLPDGSVPLHPPVLSEDAASLLPDQPRAAVLWTIDLDEGGEPRSVHVERAVVCSTAQFDYATVQAAIDSGSPHPSVAALPELGRLRRALAVRRGAIELALPEQEIVPADQGQWRLVVRPRTEVDSWNAEISLLTGMCAAQLMLGAGIGILRTLPTAHDGAVRDLRRSAAALGVPWPEEVGAAEMLAGLDPAEPTSLALSTDATRLLRGAGYTAFDGQAPEVTVHAGIGAPYAHVTAPIRRLVDRFATEVCLAVTAGEPVPDWVRRALPELPAAMEASDRVAAQVDRACIDQVESWLLADRVGESFDAVVLRANGESGEIFVAEPPVLGKCRGEGLAEGQWVRVRLVEADPMRRKIAFER